MLVAKMSQIDHKQFYPGLEQIKEIDMPQIDQFMGDNRASLREMANKPFYRNVYNLGFLKVF